MTFLPTQWRQDTFHTHLNLIVGISYNTGPNLDDMWSMLWTSYWSDFSETEHKANTHICLHKASNAAYTVWNIDRE